MVDVKQQYWETFDEVLEALGRVAQSPGSLDDATVEHLRRQLTTVERLGILVRSEQMGPVTTRKSGETLLDRIDQLQISLAEQYQEAIRACQELRALAQSFDANRADRPE